MINEKWEKCVDFHGHECPGLAIGVKACEAAANELNLCFSKDEELVCITETDACCVDAIQVLLGCSFGKGNLIYQPRGKIAFTFYKRSDNTKLRFVLKDLPSNLNREQTIKYLLSANPIDVFDVKKTDIVLPEKARIYKSIKCEVCGEKVAEPWIRLSNGKKVCLDCSK